MPYRQGRTSGGHGPGHFDDPFMIPEPDPIGEGPSQRWQAVLCLAAVVIGIALLAMLTR